MGITDSSRSHEAANIAIDRIGEVDPAEGGSDWRPDRGRLAVTGI